MPSRASYPIFRTSLKKGGTGDGLQ
eukprot:SAG31_NODE_29198_length_399_cov_0.863333_1_plen_24_part_10